MTAKLPTEAEVKGIFDKNFTCKTRWFGTRIVSARPTGTIYQYSSETTLVLVHRTNGNIKIDTVVKDEATGRQHVVVRDKGHFDSHQPASIRMGVRKEFKKAVPVNREIKPSYRSQLDEWERKQEAAGRKLPAAIRAKLAL